LKKTEKAQTDILDKPPVSQSGMLDFLKQGTKVRVQLSEPKSISGKALSTKTFRASDIRFDPKVEIIDKVLVQPDQPVLYILKDRPHTAYTKNQLQVVSSDEKDFSKEKPLFETEDNRFQVEKLVNRKLEDGKIYYLVKWKNYSSKNNTWELKSDLIHDIPRLIQNFDRKNKVT
jgi:hypothetical protein